MNTGYEGLDAAFDTNFEPDLSKAEEKAKRLDEIKKEIAAKGKEPTLQDKEYMEFEIKTLISDARRVLDVLEQDLKIGASPRAFEVYATLTKSVLDGIKELRELHTNIEHIKLSKEKIEAKRSIALGQQMNPSISLKLTGPELFKMINDAKTNSQLNNINPDFEILDTKPAE